MLHFSSGHSLVFFLPLLSFIFSSVQTWATLTRHLVSAIQFCSYIWLTLKHPMRNCANRSRLWISVLICGLVRDAQFLVPSQHISVWPCFISICRVLYFQWVPCLLFSNIFVSVIFHIYRARRSIMDQASDPPFQNSLLTCVFRCIVFVLFCVDTFHSAASVPFLSLCLINLVNRGSVIT